MSEIVLSIRDLTVNYYTRQGVVNALDGVELDVYQGEILAIVGESGCGKSTLARSIARILPSNAVIEKGSIILNLGSGNTVDLVRLSEDELVKIRGKIVSMIFQDPSAALSPVHKVKKQVTDHVSGEKRRVEKIAQEILKKLMMPAPHMILEKYPHELSGGMKQRIVIAASLITRPRIIIADEPTTALDVTVQAQILKMLSRLREELETTIILITHNLAVAAEIADRIAVMYAGHVVEVADVFSLFERPLHPYTKGLLKSIPKPHVDEEIEPIRGEPPSLADPPPGCRFHPRCPYVMDVCMRIKPRLEERAPGRLVACHLEER
ncbi:ABC transporter, ATP binding protein [Aeropyrum pernix K1]|uniref:Nickel import system ATP-binding protein NikD n=1 Tax=Aeropyrum pernix (strain ATCC 700893 / DSM 11879 / JCM 9820 / NBRC 100138 / K1) TaxID=272557 RepID=Q9YFE0_AERPE|nr:ABC transporter ATP-binding protein [Aeropyrum pernix]BAA79256.2 ABC transporter, ATP binding protein [Aeropyrum pernix K1]